MSTHPPTASAEWRSYWTLAVAAAAGFSLHSVASNAIGLFMEPMDRELGWGRAQISLGLTIAAFLTVPLSPLIGAAIDRWGSRTLAIPGVVLSAVALASFGLAQSFAGWIALWVFYALVSVGVKATVWTTSVSSAFSTSRGLALAAAMSGGAITSVLGPPLVYWLIATHGWREAWVWLGLGWSLPVLVLVLLFLIDARRIGETKTRGENHAAPLTAPGLSVSEAIRSAALWRIGISTLITMLIGTAAVVHQVPILVDAGVTREYAALLASLSGIAAFVGKFVMGWLMDRMHAVRISGVMLALSGVAFALLLEPLRSPAAILIAMTILGFAGGAKLQITAYLTSRYGGLKNFGKIFGVMHGLTVLGAGTGPFLAGLVYDTTGSYSAILILGIPGSLLCGALIFGLGPYPDEPSEPAVNPVPVP